ncbi:MAG TPA: DUF4192 domain-containing protein [Marmoricola sp.]|nr:DUF4192 domain-containing protein [Marmoricola sp.]
MTQPMPAPDRAPTFTARSPVDLLAITPYLLGFQPEESVVVLTFGAPRGCFHARVDLPVAVGHQREVAELVLEAVRRHDVPRVAVLVYSDDAGRSSTQATLLLEGLAGHGVEAVEVLRTDGRCWWPWPRFDGPGTSYDLSSHPFTAQRVFAGDVALGSRREVAEGLLGPPDEETAQAAEEHAERLLGRAAEGEGAGLLRAEARWVQRRIRLHLRDGRALSAPDAGRLLALSALVQVRDVAWSEMTRRTARSHVGLWRDLVRRCPPELLPGAASLLAFAAWLAGDGALAWCAVDRVLEQDPDYSMAHRVADCLTGALPPSVWTPIPEGELPVFAGDG